MTLPQSMPFGVFSMTGIGHQLNARLQEQRPMRCLSNSMTTTSSGLDPVQLGSEMGVHEQGLNLSLAYKAQGHVLHLEC